MRILISGSTGLVGTALKEYWLKKSYDVIALVRNTPKNPSNQLQWSPTDTDLDLSIFEGFDAIVHLAGEPIAAKRWSAAQKERILKSRTQGTALLANAINQLKTPPKVFICASAIGYYGNRPNESLTEESSEGNGFLAEVVQAWEASAALNHEHTRLVNMRFGIILHKHGGALKKMLPPFQLGLGGPLGNGQQDMSWVSRHDVVRAIDHALLTEALQGPVNVVAPNPVDNTTFTKVLAQTLHRPAIFPVPTFAINLLFGEMAQDTLLVSQKAYPKQLEATGFQFDHPTLDVALTHIL